MVRTGILLFLLGDTSFDLHTMLPFVCPEDFINWYTISFKMRSPLNEDMIVLDAVFTHFQNPKNGNARGVPVCIITLPPPETPPPLPCVRDNPSLSPFQKMPLVVLSYG